MRRVHTTAHYRTSHARGVSMLIFVLIIVPAFLFGVALAIDISSLINRYNYNQNVAESAVEAGATARDVNTGQLDPVQATIRANAICSQLTAGRVTSCASTNGPTVTANVPMQSFRLFGNTYWSGIISIDFSRFTASETASVCNSYIPTGQSDQYCVRPS